MKSKVISISENQATQSFSERFNWVLDESGLFPETNKGRLKEVMRFFEVSKDSASGYVSRDKPPHPNKLEEFCQKLIEGTGFATSKKLLAAWLYYGDEIGNPLLLTSDVKDRTFEDYRNAWRIMSSALNHDYTPNDLLAMSDEQITSMIAHITNYTVGKSKRIEELDDSVFDVILSITLNK